MAALDSPVDTPAISHLLSPNHMKPEPSKRPSSPDSHETIVAHWRERVIAHPPSSDPSLLHSSTSIPSTEIVAISIIPSLSTEFTTTPYVLSNTPVHATSTHVINTMPSHTSSVRLSCKRRRSPVTSVTTTVHTPAALAPALADLLSIRKRFRDLVFDYEASVEDVIEADVEADSEADGKIGGEADVRIDVEDVEAEESDGDKIEIDVDAVHPKPVTLVVFAVLTIVVRLVERGEAIHEVANVERDIVHATVRSLGAIETRLRGTLAKYHAGIVCDENIVQIKNCPQAALECQKNYVDIRCEPLEFQVKDKVMLKVSPWKGKCLSDETLAISLDEIQIDDKLHFIEEQLEIMDHKVKRLKQSRISIVKVQWNSRSGPEFTWKGEDQFQKKYLHLFLNTVTAPNNMA
nr:hypothetical protein [Tanacetum cinerariifolium]